MYYTPGHFFKKSATGGLVHHYSYPSAQFDGNYTGFILCFHMGYNCMIPYNGASKQIRQRKFARSKRSFSEVLTTCKMSRGWKMCCELRNSDLARRVALATMV